MHLSVPTYLIVVNGFAELNVNTVTVTLDFGSFVYIEFMNFVAAVFAASSLVTPSDVLFDFMLYDKSITSTIFTASFPVVPFLTSFTAAFNSDTVVVTVLLSPLVVPPKFAVFEIVFPIEFGLILAVNFNSTLLPFSSSAIFHSISVFASFNFPPDVILSAFTSSSDCKLSVTFIFL